MPDEPAGAPLIHLSIYSDVICPWCYVGHKEVNRAVDRVTKEVPGVRFLIEFLPFRLDPSLADDKPVDKQTRYIAKFGQTRLDSILKMLKERGKALGINFEFGGVMRQTTLAHRLLLRAWKKGGMPCQQAVLDGLFTSYFEDNEDPGDIDVLARIADKTELMSEEEAVTFLESKELSEEVKQQIQSAQHNGITGVPFTVIDGKWAVSGGQTAEVFYQIFAKLARGQDP